MLNIWSSTGFMAHELAEASSDPLVNAWYDDQGYENADKCYNNYLQTWNTLSGAQYNIIVDEKKYLIQTNWNLETNSCAMIDKLREDKKTN